MQTYLPFIYSSGRRGLLECDVMVFYDRHDFTSWKELYIHCTPIFDGVQFFPRNTGNTNYCLPSLLPFQTKYIAGNTSSSMRLEVTIPPTIGAAILFITSAPAPVPHMIGSRPAMIA